MKGLLRKARNLARHVAPEVAGRLEAAVDALRPDLGQGFGVLNGQQVRQAVVRAMFARLRFAAVVETGTFRGTTAAFLRREFGVPVHTVELEARYYHFSRRRFRNEPGVTVYRGDSRAFLRRLAADGGFPKSNVFFYLDAHWGTDLPLAEEIDTIGGAWRDFVVLIDDFEVPGDPGYGFDDYGPGKRLSVTEIDLRRPGTTLFFPSVPSSADSGARRGYVLIASEGKAADALRTIPELREHR